MPHSEKKSKHEETQMDIEEDDEVMVEDSSPASKKKTSLPEHIEEKKTRVKMGLHAPQDTQTISYHSSFKNLGHDNSLNVRDWKKNFKIEIIEKTEEELVFDMIGVDAPIANAFRRILLSEVPTMAIEKVVIVNNTGVIQDEILSHRLGLVPILADPRIFAFPQGYEEKNKTVFTDFNGTEWDPQSYPLYENQHLCFKLDVTCRRKSPNSEELINSNVYSSHLQWVPIGKQATILKNNPPRPVHQDILLCKLKPGQNIHVECYVEKGIGKSHAKWSPVATATYRLLPDIKLSTSIKNEQAKELKEKCPMGVFDIEDLGNGDKKAVVARPRDCTMCRECIREEGWENLVKLTRKKDHYIFSIESTGIMKPEEIFVESIKILHDKCKQTIKQLRQELQEGGEDEEK